MLDDDDLLVYVLCVPGMYVEKKKSSPKPETWKVMSYIEGSSSFKQKEKAKACRQVIGGAVVVHVGKPSGAKELPVEPAEEEI